MPATAAEDNAAAAATTILGDALLETDAVGVARVPETEALPEALGDAEPDDAALCDATALAVAAALSDPLPVGLAEPVFERVELAEGVTCALADELREDAEVPVATALPPVGAAETVRVDTSDADTALTVDEPVITRPDTTLEALDDRDGEVLPVADVEALTDDETVGVDVIESETRGERDTDGLCDAVALTAGLREPDGEVLRVRAGSVIDGVAVNDADSVRAATVADVDPVCVKERVAKSEPVALPVREPVREGHVVPDDEPLSDVLAVIEPDAADERDGEGLRDSVGETLEERDDPGDRDADAEPRALDENDELTEAENVATDTVGENDAIPVSDGECDALVDRDAWEERVGEAETEVDWVPCKERENEEVTDGEHVKVLLCEDELDTEGERDVEGLCDAETEPRDERDGEELEDGERVNIVTIGLRVATDVDDSVFTDEGDWDADTDSVPRDEREDDGDAEDERDDEGLPEGDSEPRGDRDPERLEEAQRETLDVGEPLRTPDCDAVAVVTLVCDGTDVNVTDSDGTLGNPEMVGEVV